MPKNMTPGKPYTIAMVGLNDAEINLYGEVVQSRPVDWWTGQPMGGNFICVDEFLKDLEELSAKDNITVHINSVGGDFYAGLAIYNRLRNLSANVTTINDGLAASAGSIIFMAGNKRKMHAGSNLMVHGVLGFFYGYYNVGDLRTSIKELEAHNKAAIAAYVEATGLDAEVVKAAMSKDTYMVGQEAVDLGWADEVITDDEGEETFNMKLAPDRTTMMVNGYRVAARCIGKIPDSVPVMTDEEWAEVSAPVDCAKPAPQDSNNIIQDGGKENMEKFSNLDELRAAYPDLLAEAESVAQAKGCADERARLQGIEAIEKAIGDTALVNRAKYGEKPMTAEQLAFAAMQAQAAIGNTMLQKMEQDTKASGVDTVEATPAAPEKPEMTEDEQAMALLTAAVNNKKEGK